ncbi:MAG TPA: LptF/LptG family permease [Saprospiraceae bacterium]|nr:LptF/LptG family permease [Saprospiraceae bacterium]
MVRKKRWYHIGYQIDRLLVSSFIPPFMMAFFIALFVLIMQFLWKFIEDIIGKGVGALLIMEMFFYKSISLFPLALPISVLLASVMVMGNMAERFELSSFKSAGISLTRILLPLILVASLIAIFSFYCSNTIIPIANLKYQSRLYDIRNQRPTLSIEPGVFNEDFRGYAIRVGKKLSDKKTIEDIMVYDDSQRNRGELNVVTAQRGEMYVSNGAFVMTLFDGNQYSEAESNSKPNGLPFTISHFKEWTRKFDLSEFNLDRTEEEQFKAHQMMKSARQIAIEIDTLEEQINLEKRNYNIKFLVLSDSSVAPSKAFIMKNDSARIPQVKNLMPDAVFFNKSFPSERYQMIRHILDSIPVAGATSMLTLFPEVFLKDKKSRIVNNLIVQQSTVDRTDRSVERLELTKRKHTYQLHWKFSLAFACIVMLMIGGPMGTIVRKGGFGYPLLVSILFFTFFLMSNISSQKLNDAGKMNPVLAAWFPVVLLSLIASFLTFKALNDSKIMDLDRLKTYFARFRKKSKEIHA